MKLPCYIKDTEIQIIKNIKSILVLKEEISICSVAIVKHSILTDISVFKVILA